VPALVLVSYLEVQGRMPAIPDCMKDVHESHGVTATADLDKHGGSWLDQAPFAERCLHDVQDLTLTPSILR
jgi:hypothetical protein